MDRNLEFDLWQKSREDWGQSSDLCIFPHPVISSFRLNVSGPEGQEVADHGEASGGGGRELQEQQELLSRSTDTSRLQ